MGPLLAAAIPAIGSVVGGALGYFGQRDTNAANARQAQLNRDFQERMSNTAVQRHKADLIAAGYNPALAVGAQASSPLGTSTTFENAAGAGANSAASAAQTIANVRATMAQAQKTQAETDRVIMENDYRAQVIPREFATIIEEMEHRGVEAAWQKMPEVIAMRRRALENDIRRSTAGAQAAEYELPGMRNAANAANTWWGRYISPYLNDAKTVGSAAATLATPTAIMRGGSIMRGASAAAARNQAEIRRQLNQLNTRLRRR